MVVKNPLVSVIIPTYKRPEYLSRAVESALASMVHGELEVIVIPNGGDSSWKSSLRKWKENPFVKIYESSPPNPNIARNLGLKLAKGQLIRFLDDDDYLIPEIARKQYLELLSSEYDLSIYGARTETADRTIHGVFHAPLEEDYGAMVLREKFLALPFTTVYKRACLADVFWNEELRIPEDEEWMRKIVATREIRHTSSKEIVGVWFQHDLSRLSMPLPNDNYFRNKATSILETCEALKTAGRLTSHRKKAAAKGLWGAAHGGFYFSPVHWTKVAIIAKKYDPQSYPDDPLFRVLKFISPLAIEWIMLPKRWGNYLSRRLLLNLASRRKVVRKAPG